MNRMMNADNLQELKAASRQLVRASGKQEGAAMITRVRHQALSDYGNHNKPDIFMPIDVAGDLMLDSGDPSLVRAFAHMVHCEVIPLPKSLGDGALQCAMGQTSKEIGDVFKTIGESMADGRFDAKETKLCRAEIWEAIQALLRLAQSIEEGE